MTGLQHDSQDQADTGIQQEPLHTRDVPAQWIKAGSQIGKALFDLFDTENRKPTPSRTRRDLGQAMAAN